MASLAPSDKPKAPADLLMAAEQAYALRDCDDEPESEKYWAPVWELRRRGDAEVLKLSELLLKSASVAERVLAVDVLAEIHIGTPDLRSQAADSLVNAFQHEAEASVLAAMGLAFGHNGDHRAVPLFAPLSIHPDEDVRFGVVAALTTHTSDESISTLIRLTRDTAVRVRDWATFGLGSQCDADTVELREALYQRLQDEDDQTRGEALVGLARRKDERVVELIAQRLNQCDLDTFLLEAAEEFGFARFGPELRELENAGAEHDDSWRRMITSARKAHSEENEC
jgi:HEAT repeat protein